MVNRPDELTDVLDAARAAYEAHAHDPRAKASFARIFGALDTPGPLSNLAGTRLPVCEHLAPAADPSRFADPSLRRLAEAFLRIEPKLTWRRRGGEAPAASPDFSEGHANAMIVGPGGFETRHDAWLGVSLLAPHVRYPDHTHAPEETYLVLSKGAFSQDNGPWFEPGVGGSFYNTPGILHAMRADDEPFFAFWALWAH
jgi:hypothetical protein